MSDRQRVVYKTPLFRFAETGLVLLSTIAIATLWHVLVPGLSTGFAIIASLALGFLVVPFLGAKLAERWGAPMMTREERSRRYLSELGPIGLTARALPAYSSARRTGGRSVRR